MLVHIYICGYVSNVEVISPFHQFILSPSKLDIVLSLSLSVKVCTYINSQFCSEMENNFYTVRVYVCEDNIMHISRAFISFFKKFSSVDYMQTHHPNILIHM